MSEPIMSDEFDGLDATEKAGIEGALNKCRRLAAQIESEVRNRRPEHFVDELSLADLCPSLEQASDVLGQKGRRSVENTSAPVKGSQARHHSIPRSVTSSTGLPRTSSYSPGRRLLNMVGK